MFASREKEAILFRGYFNVVVTAIIHESVVRRRKLRITVGFAKIFQILAVVFGTEIEWHACNISSHVNVDTYSSSSVEDITTLDQPNRSCVG
jgi:hypothetical protein